MKVLDANGVELKVGMRVRDSFHENEAEVRGFGTTSLPGVSRVELSVDELGPTLHFVGESGCCPDLIALSTEEAAA